MAMLLLSTAGFAQGFDIVGTWNEYELDQQELDGVWVFNADGTGTVEEFYHGQSEGVAPLTYTFDASANVLTVIIKDEEPGEPEEPWVMPITIVSSAEFTYTDGHDTLRWVKQGSSGIRQPSTARGTVLAVYSADGHRLSGLSHGLNIIRYADGTTVKVVR